MTFTIVIACYLVGLLMGLLWGRGRRQKLLKLCQDSLTLCETQQQMLEVRQDLPHTLALNALVMHAEWTRPRQQMH